jgi:predicted nucleic acid-binding protein
VILVDTSVWIDHFRTNDDHFAKLLDVEVIWIHPFVLGELALGNLRPRAATLQILHRIPRCDVVSNFEFLHFIERYRLFATGVGFVDAHLMASSRMMAMRLWTHDKRLHAVAENLGLGYTTPR